MDKCVELRSSMLASLERLRNLRIKLEGITSDSEERLKRPIYRSSFFLTPTPLRSGVDHGDTGYRSIEGHPEDKYSGGGNPEVTEPGMGSLTVTGPVGGRVVTKDKTGGAVATEDLIEFGGDSQRSSDSEVRGVAQVAPEDPSDIERRRSVKIIMTKVMVIVTFILLQHHSRS